MTRNRVRCPSFGFSLLAAYTAWADTPDHLKCYPVKDPQAKASYTADLGGLVAEPGCIIQVPAHLFCTQATKANVVPTPPGGPGSTGAAGRFLCYKVKCPKGTLPTIPWNDQFGSRTLTPKNAKLLCAPETAAPTCANGGIPCTTSGTSPSCGGCAGAECAGPSTSNTCSVIHCGSTTPVCSQPGFSGQCPTDADGPSGKVCLATPFNPNACGNPALSGCATPCPE